MKKHYQLKALLMAALMCVSLVPVTALAEEREETETVMVSKEEMGETEAVMASEEKTEETETVMDSEAETEETEIVMVEAEENSSSVKKASASVIPDDVLDAFWAYSENGWQKIEKGADAELNVIVDIDEQYWNLLTYEWGYYTDWYQIGWVKMATTKQPTYTVPSVTEMREYYCKIYYGSRYLQDVLFTVNLENHFRAYAKDEQNVVKVKKGESATFEVEVEGDDLNGVVYVWSEDRGRPAYEWLDNVRTNTCVIPNIQ